MEYGRLVNRFQTRDERLHLATESLLRSLAEFHRDPRYAGDLHRADMAWARHAAAIKFSAAETRAELMRARDLSKKGNLKSQREYAEQTVVGTVGQGLVGQPDDVVLSG